MNDVDKINQTKEFVKDWEENGDFYKYDDDELTEYFAANFEASPYTEIGDEGVRLFNVAFGQEIQDDSPMSDIIQAVAYHSFLSACNLVSQMLDVEEFIVFEALSDSGYPKSIKKIGFDGIKKLINEYQSEMEAELSNE